MIQNFKGNKIPLICVPITGKTEKEIMEQLAVVIQEQPDVIEWRGDFFEGLDNVSNVLHIIETIKRQTSIPLLFTIRAEHEGGEKITLDEDGKVALLITICEKSFVDIVDFELSNREANIKKISQCCTQYNKQLILSYHNFDETPHNELLCERAELAVTYDADIVKLAVMPKDKDDVLRLLHVTKLIDESIDLPVITMSMGQVGGLSRLMGWAYGSVLTFAVGVEQSAPGQIPIRQLRDIIQQTQNIVEGRPSS